MKVEINEAGPCRKEMRIKADASAVESEYNGLVKLYASRAKVAGFRKGKAPLNVVENKFSKEICEDTKDRLVPLFYKQALEQENINPVAIVEVKDVSFVKEPR